MEWTHGGVRYTLVDSNVGLLLNGQLVEIRSFEETHIGMQMAHALKISLMTSRMEEWDSPIAVTFLHDRVGPHFFAEMRAFVGKALNDRFGV